MFFKKPSGVQWIIAFLGNPGPQYNYTRHNAGFMVGDSFEKKFNVTINRSRFKALTAVCTVSGNNVLLMKPQTYMNLSGEAIGQAARFYKIPADHIIVVSDEMSLPIGKIRIREKGSAGGHNGLKNIISVLGTDEFPRIRLGVGAPPSKDFDVKDWVLAVFHDQDLSDMMAACSKAADAVECYIAYGPSKAMNQYN